MPLKYFDNAYDAPVCIIVNIFLNKKLWFKCIQNTMHH